MTALRLATLAVLALVAGCASIPDDLATHKHKPLSSYADDPFVPINLYLNSNEQVSGTLEMLIQHSAEHLRASGAFVRVDRGVQRWPITLQARYELKEDVASGDTVRRVLGALTLGLVPVYVTQTHVLHAEVLAEPASVGALEISMTVRNRVSLYDLGEGGTRSERVAAEALLERLVAEIAQRKMIPRWAAFKPGTPPPKKPLPPLRDGHAT